MSSACATSGHCIGNSVELIQSGKQKIMFAGRSVITLGYDRNV